MTSHKLAIVFIILLGTMRSFGEVYSSAIYAGGVSYYGDHCVGSGPFRFGYSEYSYSTDVRGYIIMFSTNRTTQPGDTFHRRTEIYFGPASFSVAMRPLPFLLVAVFGLSVTFATGNFVWRHLRRRRHEPQVA